MRHFLLCQHGLLGTDRDFHSFVEHFYAIPGKPVEVVILRDCAGLTQTLDGVEAGGKRCMQEILRLIQNGSITRDSEISLIGHSLGGLYIRWALRLIEIEYPAIWDEYNLKRTCCIFLATPHCGIKCSSWFIRHSVDRLLRHVSGTAQDLSLKSATLLELVDDIGLESLNHFARVVLYGNEKGDHLVSIQSALALPSSYRPVTHSDMISHVQITELVLSRDIDDDIGDNERAALVNRLNKGLQNVRRFKVSFPPGFPSFLSFVDNTAHHRIICHGILDRGKAGIPVLKHIEEMIKSPD